MPPSLVYSPVARSLTPVALVRTPRLGVTGTDHDTSQRAPDSPMGSPAKQKRVWQLFH